MQVNFQTVINGRDGKPVTSGASAEDVLKQVVAVVKSDATDAEMIRAVVGALNTRGNKPLTLKDICVNVLDNPPQKELEGADGAERRRRGNLADKIYNAAEPMNVSAEDIALLKTLIGKIYYPLYVQRAMEAIDPEPAPKEKKK